VILRASGVGPAGLTLNIGIPPGSAIRSASRVGAFFCDVSGALREAFAARTWRGRDGVKRTVEPFAAAAESAPRLQNMIESSRLTMPTMIRMSRSCGG